MLNITGYSPVTGNAATKIAIVTSSWKHLRPSFRWDSHCERRLRVNDKIEIKVLLASGLVIAYLLHNKQTGETRSISAEEAEELRKAAR